MLRQAGDDAGDDEVAALERGRQRLGQAQRRLPPASAKPASARRAADDDRANGATRGAARAPATTRDRDAAASADVGRRAASSSRCCSCTATPASQASGSATSRPPMPGAAIGGECRICAPTADETLHVLDLRPPHRPRHRAAAAGHARRRLRAVRAQRQPGLPLRPHRQARRQGLGRPARPRHDTATGKKAARAVAIDLLGTLHAAAGDLDKVERIVKVTSLVNSAPDFTEHHLVTNGCSELLGEVFADKGAHARSAFGVAQLPIGACVEIELIAQAARMTRRACAAAPRRTARGNASLVRVRRRPLVRRRRRRARLAARLRHAAVPVVRAAAADLPRDRRRSPLLGLVWRGAGGSRVAAAVASLLAVAGVAAALWQHFVAAKSASCNLTLADRIVSATQLDRLLPDVFEARASCADAAVNLFGVPYAMWSALGFVVCAVALIRLLRARA